MPNIEELLRQAIADGKFDNLPGKGKPLHLDQANPLADPEWELAYHLLKDSGYSLPWFETIHDIEEDIELARQDLQIAWKWHQDAQVTPQNVGDTSAGWERSQNAFRDKLTSLNKQIRDYNLQVPNARFQRPALNYERELQKITNDQR